MDQLINTCFESIYKQCVSRKTVVLHIVLAVLLGYSSVKSCIVAAYLIDSAKYVLF